MPAASLTQNRHAACGHPIQPAPDCPTLAKYRLCLMNGQASSCMSCAAGYVQDSGPTRARTRHQARGFVATVMRVALENRVRLTGGESWTILSLWGQVAFCWLHIGRSRHWRCFSSMAGLVRFADVEIPRNRTFISAHAVVKGHISNFDRYASQERIREILDDEIENTVSFSVAPLARTSCHLPRGDQRVGGPGIR